MEIIYLTYDCGKVSSMKDIIYFTKEDGSNKMLFTSDNGTNWRGAISKAGLAEAEKHLGHRPTNVYMLVDGCEIKLI